MRGKPGKLPDGERTAFKCQEISTAERFHSNFAVRRKSMQHGNELTSVQTI